MELVQDLQTNVWSPVTLIPALIASLDRMTAELRTEVKRATDLVAKKKPKKDADEWKLSLSAINLSAEVFPTAAKHLPEIAQMRFKGVTLIDGWLYNNTVQEGTSQKVCFFFCTKLFW